MITTENVKAAVDMMVTTMRGVAELGQVPTSRLYAELMGGMSQPMFDGMVRAMVKTGLVEHRDHMLIWVGEPLPQSA